MIVTKKHIVKKSSPEPDEEYVNGTPEERILMVWEITRDTWAFMGKGDVERRLQRHITKFIRRRS